MLPSTPKRLPSEHSSSSPASSEMTKEVVSPSTSSPPPTPPVNSPSPPALSSSNSPSPPLLSSSPVARSSSRCSTSSLLDSSGKRGRPRADLISHLIDEGANSHSEIKCKQCNRVFPREKSLQAHMRTHTGEKPYQCDYPGCSKAFAQSGQLKTHQRLHAGEKPFACSAQGCSNRYTHANRMCPDHPKSKPTRTSDLILQPILTTAEDTPEVHRWIEKYRKERMEKTPFKLDIKVATVCQPLQGIETRLTPSSKRDLDSQLEQEENRPANSQTARLPATCEGPLPSDCALLSRSPVRSRPTPPLRPSSTLSSPSVLQARLVLSSPKRKPSSNPVKPKKRWQMEVNQTRSCVYLESPLPWADEDDVEAEEMRMMQFLAAQTLIDLRGSSSVDDQPLNLSIAKAESPI